MPAVLREAPRLSPDSQEKKSAMPTRILIADPDGQAVDTLKKACRSYDIQFVQAVGDGDAAAKLIEDKPYDLYMVDQGISGKSCLELVGAVREHQPEAPFMMLTRERSKQIVAEAVQAGVSDFVSRPIEEQEIVTKLGSWLRILGHLNDSSEAVEEPEVQIAEQDSGDKEKAATQLIYQCIRPFVESTIHTFHTMLRWDLSRQHPYRLEGAQPPHEITGIIRLTGKANGLAALSIERQVAIEIAHYLLAETVTEINAGVRDAVGEMANVVSGGAKATLHELALSAGLPEVVIGRNRMLDFPRGSTPIALPFDTQWGRITLVFAMTPAS